VTRARYQPHRDRPGLRATYTVAELADLTGRDRHAVRRLLDKMNVTWLTTDPRTVTVTELRRVAPDLWDAIALVQSLRASG
jgi:hypothetical protein